MCAVDATAAQVILFRNTVGYHFPKIAASNFFKKHRSYMNLLTLSNHFSQFCFFYGIFKQKAATECHLVTYDILSVLKET